MVTPLSPAAAILLVGGLASLSFATLAGYVLYWVRVRDVTVRPPTYALVTHTSAITHGLVLIALAVAVDHTGFSRELLIAFAVAEVLVTAGGIVRNLRAWADRIDDGFADIGPVARRWRGVANTIHLVVVMSVTYGVARTALGI